MYLKWCDPAGNQSKRFFSCFRYLSKRDLWGNEDSFIYLCQKTLKKEGKDIQYNGKGFRVGFGGEGGNLNLQTTISFLQTIFNMDQNEGEVKSKISLHDEHAEVDEKASNDDDATEKRSLWSRLKHPNIACPKINKAQVLTVLVVLAAVAILTSLVTIYVGRKPEVVYISDPITINFEKSQEEIEKYFFNISGITYTGRIDEGRSAVSIVRASSSYNPLARLLQDTTIYFEPLDQGNRLLQTSTPILPKDGKTNDIDAVNMWRPFGFIDGLAEDRGLVVRALNPENRIYYIDYESLIRYASQTHTAAASRRLTAHTEGRVLEETTEDYFADVLAKKFAIIEGVDLERIIVNREEVWVGTRNQETNEYTIPTASTQTTTTPPTSNLTAEEKTKAAQALYDSVLKGVIEEKKLQLQDYGAIIADYFGFSFDRYVDLYVTFEKVTSLGGEIEEEKTAETNSTNSTVKRPTPRRPTIIVKAYEPVYGNQPARLKEGKTISRDTFDEIITCVDYNETTKACTIEEWSNADSPFKISEVSMSNQVNLAVQTRYRVSIRPLPADQVVQEPYEKIDPMEMYKHVSDDNNNSNEAPIEQTINMQAQGSSPSGSKDP